MNKQAVKKLKSKKSKKTESKEIGTDKDVCDDTLGPKPSVYDTLPFQVFELCKLVPDLPVYIQDIYEEYKYRKNEQMIDQEQEEISRKLFEQKELIRKQRKSTGLKSTSSCTESS